MQWLLRMVAGCRAVIGISMIFSRVMRIRRICPMSADDNMSGNTVIVKVTRRGEENSAMNAFADYSIDAPIGED